VDEVALLLPAASLVVVDASLLWALGLGDELVTVDVLPVTNPRTVDAAVAAGLVIMEAEEGDDELRPCATLVVVALHEDVEEVFLVLLVDSGTISAEEANVVFNVAMCYKKLKTDWSLGGGGEAMQVNQSDRPLFVPDRSAAPSGHFRSTTMDSESPRRREFLTLDKKHVCNRQRCRCDPETIRNAKEG
jgi:hypothetical protein